MSQIISWVVENIGIIAILIAIIVGLINAFSLKYTRDALTLTRNTQRPFLCIAGYHPILLHADIVLIHLIIKNSGALPAFNMNVRLDFFAEEEKVELFKLSEKYKVWLGDEINRPPVFPNIEWNWEDCLHKDDEEQNQIVKDMIENKKVKIRTTITYESKIYRSTAKHTTIATVEWTTSGTNERRLYDCPPADST